MQPSRPPRKPAQPLPLAPILAAGLIVLGLSQLAWYSWQTLHPQAQTSAGDNIFQSVLNLKQRHARAQAVATRQPAQLALPETRPLLILGNPDGPVTLTIFCDPTLAQHRRMVQHWQKLANPYGRIELRYAPAQPAETMGGLAMVLARALGQEYKLWQALQTKNTDWDTQALMTQLAKLGIPLTTLRSLLSTPNPQPLVALQSDIAWTNAYNITAPFILLDGYPLSLPPLSPERLRTYITRRLQGEPLAQPADYL